MSYDRPSTVKIIKATAFDPALSGDYEDHVRLELLVAGNLDEPSRTELGDVFSVFYYGPLMRIYTDLDNWNDEMPERCAQIYNTHFTNEQTKPVIPVTVSHEGDMWETYYLSIDRVSKLLRKFSTNYEVLPHPTFSLKKEHAWYLQHKSRVCVFCAEEWFLNGVEADPDLPNECEIVEINSYMHRLAAVCPDHLVKVNSKNALASKAETVDN